VGYWRYGISFNVYAIAMMESACGTDFGLSGKNGFRKTAEYPNLATGPLGMTIGYSDCGTSRGALPVLWWFAKRFGRPDILTEHEVRAWDAAPEGDGHYPPVELFWMDGRWKPFGTELPPRSGRSRRRRARNHSILQTPVSPSSRFPSRPTNPAAPARRSSFRWHRPVNSSLQEYHCKIVSYYDIIYA
jgi:hypothetical protein